MTAKPSGKKREQPFEPHSTAALRRKPRCCLSLLFAFTSTRHGLPQKGRALQKHRKHLLRGSNTAGHVSFLSCRKHCWVRSWHLRSLGTAQKFFGVALPLTLGIAPCPATRGLQACLPPTDISWKFEQTFDPEKHKKQHQREGLRVRCQGPQPDLQCCSDLQSPLKRRRHHRIG